MYIYFTANFSKTSAYYFNRESKKKPPKKTNQKNLQKPTKNLLTGPDASIACEFTPALR